MVFFQYLFFKLLKKLRGKALYKCKISSKSKIEAGTECYFTNMDKYSFCGYNCLINYAQIGSFTSIANGVIIGGNNHPLNWASMSPVFYSDKDSLNYKFSIFEKNPPVLTIIGSDVWIGQNVIIKQGLTIGHGSVIGMGSVVTKDVLPYQVVAGNPAKFIKYRFSTEIIADLLSLKWWSFDVDRIKELAPYVTDIEEFIRKAQK
jgi:acetyltransferase-like isoleucine patch superfamily enzyme